jgi:hypothetical protein
MRLIHLVLVSILFKTVYAQDKIIPAIDNYVQEIERNQYFYTADISDNLIGEDSDIVGWWSMVYRYSDSKGKNLIKVDQLLNSFRDTSSLYYYFKNNKLIMVDVHRIINGQTHIQTLYFEHGKFVYSTLKTDLKFDPETYIENSKALLKFKAKTYTPSFIN